MPSRPLPLITLTTDFGSGSPYVGQMKGAILSLVRQVDLVDLSHAIGPQNIREGAIVLADTTPQFPTGTIHVAVIDPGVGTSRRLVYCEIDGQRYLAPDNGLLSYLLRRKRAEQIVSLEDRRFWRRQPSHTFHGRDILAPVAAQLALGVDPTQLGPCLASDDLVRLPWPEPQRTHERIDGEVLYIDSFGNLITSIDRVMVESLGPTALLISCCGDWQIRGLVTSYNAANIGELVALFDSQDRLEIALVGGSAARALSVNTGDLIQVRLT